MLFFFQAEDGIRDLVRSRGLGDVYKRQEHRLGDRELALRRAEPLVCQRRVVRDLERARVCHCLLYTSDAADDPPSVDLGGRRILTKKTTKRKRALIEDMTDMTPPASLVSSRVTS